MINIGEPAIGKSMLGWLIDKINCRSGIHDWSPEDLNEFTPHMEVGDEATIRCKKCNTQIVTIEKLPHKGGMRWIPHVKEAVMYEVNPEYTRKQGQKYDLDKFREENK